MNDARRTVTTAVAHAVEDGRLWPSDSTLLVAVSGGADSLCLLGALLDLRDLRPAIAPAGIVVATLDHGLRGVAGAADARWVTALAEGLGLRCIASSVDTLALARGHKLSIEDAARRLRYRFLRQTASETGAACICVAHTLDDQAETVLLHLLRGAGLAGLSGMRPLSEGIARPLLAVTRDQTLAYCAARGWDPRQDETNHDPRYTRNRIRRDLLPALEAFNPKARQALARMASTLADDAALLGAVTDCAWTEIIRSETPDAVRLGLAALGGKPRALQRRLLRRAIAHVAAAAPVEEITGPAPIESRHIALIEQLVARGTTGATLDLPQGLRVNRDYDELQIKRDSQHTTPLAPPSQVTWLLNAPGVVEAAELGWRVRAVVTDAPPGLEGDQLEPQPDLPPVAHAGTAAAARRGEWRAYADADAAGVQFTVRAWLPGDRFRPLGVKRAKKLQDVFADAKVPRAVRGRLPLVCVGRGAEERIVWVAGVRIGDEFRLTADSRRTLVLQAEPLESYRASS